MNADTRTLLAVAATGFFGLLWLVLNRRFQSDRDSQKAIQPVVDSLREAIAPIENTIHDDRFYAADATAFTALLEGYTHTTAYAQLSGATKNHIESCQSSLTVLGNLSTQIRSALCGSFKYKDHIVANGKFVEVPALRLVLMEEGSLPIEITRVIFPFESKGNSTQVMDSTQVRDFWREATSILPLKAYLNAKAEALLRVSELDKVLRKTQGP
jgi:hypothetical protein